VSDPDAGASATPLELLHPAGVAERVLVDGGSAGSLLPHAVAHDATAADLAIVAPSAAELARRGWLAHSIDRAASAIAPDGIVCAALPPVARAAAGRRLRAAGLELDGAVARFPAGSPRYLIPLRPRPWRHMLANEIGAHARIRRALVATAALPLGERALAETLPGVLLFARPPGAAPPAEWLERLGGDVPGTAHVAVMTSWRGAAGPVVLFCFAAGDNAPWGVVKLGRDSHREAQSIERMGPAARAAGARVPRTLVTGTVGGRPVLVETPVDGRSAARVLAQRPERFYDVVGRVADWLGRWSAATAQPAMLPADRLERELLRHDLPPSYRDWLAERAAALQGTSIPLVAAHRDLTMWNLRLGSGGALGVLDWAEAQPDGLPLTDLFYAVADAAAACDGYGNRLAAVRSCFEPGGARTPTVAPLCERLRVVLELSPEMAELCFHACWLHHAANEARGDSARRPFAEVVRWLAQRAGTS
jgi:hypothetical protein